MNVDGEYLKKKKINKKTLALNYFAGHQFDN